MPCRFIYKRTIVFMFVLPTAAVLLSTACHFRPICCSFCPDSRLTRPPILFMLTLFAHAEPTFAQNAAKAPRRHEKRRENEKERKKERRTDRLGPPAYVLLLRPFVYPRSIKTEVEKNSIHCKAECGAGGGRPGRQPQATPVLRSEEGGDGERSGLG